ncbi:unnamed protein product [Bursaphelenchus xylophilus]|uniref:(pine wood nematode) hypothetical protein n=1 Tax=Bursaphelenchus xylophilus TaxID=6326 RepID=A0A1I7RN02_BURXY|nr:unnamed protein product [Bursaphelenchus xylophilus]CAG9125300.1 unnamed protein product [Bursaphelenchus xylophilus]
MYFAFLFLALSLPALAHSRSVYSNVSTSVEAKRVVKLEVRLDKKRVSHCSGVLLSERVVATAAHCLHRKLKEPSSFTVQLGDQKAHAAKLFVHEGFDGEGGCTDVGIMILEEDIALPSEPLYVGCGLKWLSGKCNAYGYGLTEDNVLSPDVREVNYKVTESKIKGHEKPTCFTGTYPSRSKLCRGDSGGPTICRVAGKSVFVAVTSLGITKDLPDRLSRCKVSRASVLANVQAFIELLQQIPEEDRKFVKEYVNALDCPLD